MRPAATILFICFFILTSGCSKPATNQAPQPSSETASSAASNAPSLNATPSTAPVAKAKFDACSLLTSAEIQAVQGEAVQETKPSDQMSGDFVVSQCYYALPTLANSISLTLTERNPDKSGGQSVKEFWENTFGKEERKSEPERRKDRDKEKEKPRAQPDSRSVGEEEESAPPEPVHGLGDEAFWSASRIGGALYVLKSDRYIRISVGGKGNAEAKLKKAKTLAQKALRRL
jgi:hypothetical protein